MATISEVFSSQISQVSRGIVIGSYDMKKKNLKFSFLSAISHNHFLSVMPCFPKTGHIYIYSSPRKGPIQYNCLPPTMVHCQPAQFPLSSIVIRSRDDTTVYILAQSSTSLSSQSTRFALEAAVVAPAATTAGSTFTAAICSR